MNAKENPAGGPGFREWRGGDPNPQENLEAFSHNCQEISEPISLLAERYFVHVQKWADSEREARLLVAEIMRLEKQLNEAMDRAHAAETEMTRVQRLAHERGVV